MATFLVSILIAILTSSLHTAERVSDEDWLQDANASTESAPAATHEADRQDSISFSAMEAKGKELQDMKKKLETEVLKLDEKERQYKKANEEYGYSSAALAESLNSFAKSVEGFRQTVSDANRKTVDETREVMKAPMEGGLGGGSEEPSQENAGVDKKTEREEAKT